MRTALLVYYHSPQHISWIQFQAPAKILNTRLNTSIETLPKQCYPVYVLFTGTQCTLQQAETPTKQRQRLAQAIPYILEEQLAQDVELLHFAIGTPRNNEVAVAVVSHDTMQTCLQAFQQQGIQPTMILPEMLALPYHGESTWSVMLWEEKVIVRTGESAGFSIELNNVSALLQTQTSLPEKIHVFSSPQNEALLTTLHGLGVNVEQHSHSEPTLAWFVRSLKSYHPLNCLQDEYIPQNKATSLWKVSRLTLALLGILAIVLVGQIWLEVQQLKQQRQQLTQQINQLYRQTFPDARKVVNARAQMEQKLLSFQKQNQQPVAPSFLQLLKSISPALSQAKDFQLQRLDYRHGNFDLQITVADLQSLEKVKQQLARQQFQVEINSAVSQNNFVKSRLRIRYVAKR
ncbi:type II secretion system protein GspL [Candidatus Albibeggiatoa sp. nov. NOAA]|uniref:type II secretion system protein GspL n=1 Tax=Candidatus Albibeggiatoa sp. nov. NOAA TaxID=3162724 RepID=UPI0033031E9E|nr:type II secretion system protein GspL [Thiotrichaceae bacterium]